MTAWALPSQTIDDDVPPANNDADGLTMQSTTSMGGRSVDNDGKHQVEDGEQQPCLDEPEKASGGCELAMQWNARHRSLRRCREQVELHQSK